MAQVLSVFVYLGATNIFLLNFKWLVAMAASALYLYSLKKY
jgi:hypothetical protein